uniref:Uncharacterized membrane protein (DUF2298) n=1 Tax=Eubacterium cellulosolvens (strain ATCC 43171 / JCM 9499 / 6) TaxID=633697 RepID=I5ARB6_EUBC6
MITGWVLLGADFPAFLRWYLVILAVGIGFYPLSSVMFSGFSDKGWVFAKTIGIALSGFVVWLLGCIGVMSFTNAKCIIVTLILIGVCWGIFTIRKETTLPDIDLIILEEMLFLGVFLMWTYFTCFNPHAIGLEKFMDYGFMAAMNRNPALPAKDIWYGTDIINYYYGGQYYGVFIEKLCFVPVKQAYNLYRMSIAAFAFVLPFSIVWQMVADRFAQAKRSSFGAATIGGILAGAGLSMAGNVHYVLYKLFGAFLKLEGWADYQYSSSVRYIGYNPVNEKDLCIHEFPSFSFILGDVHAHMINTMFVLTVVALLYAYVQRMKKMEPKKDAGWREFFLDLINPYFLFCGFFIGLFHWTHYWDFIIYFTVTLFIVIYAAWYRYYRTDRNRAVKTAIWETVIILAVNLLVALPFTLQFKTMVSGIRIAKHHSLPHQMLILWGLPMAVWIVLLIVLVRWFKKAKTEVPKPDIFAAILGLCGFGLILIPELVYVKDIYVGSQARFNTMFKLTYQGFILFALMMSYTFVRVLAHLEEDEEAAANELAYGRRQKGVMTLLGVYATRVITGILLVMVLNAMSDFPGVVKALAGLLLTGVYLVIWFMFEPKIGDRLKEKEGRKTVGIRAVSAMLVLLFGMTLGYMPYSVDAWFGLKTHKNIGIDCTQFLESNYAEDAEAIRWLDENVEGQPICLEANGDSYSEYERVSAMTGIPTVAGWYTHEHLWRSDTTVLDRRNSDIETIYTSKDRRKVLELLEKYEVSYIFVGSCEKKKYGNKMDADFIKKLGTVVFENDTSFVVLI